MPKYKKKLTVVAGQSNPVKPHSFLSANPTPNEILRALDAAIRQREPIDQIIKRCEKVNRKKWSADERKDVRQRVMDLLKGCRIEFFKGASHVALSAVGEPKADENVSKALIHSDQDPDSATWHSSKASCTFPPAYIVSGIFEKAGLKGNANPRAVIERWMRVMIPEPSEVPPVRILRIGSGAAHDLVGFLERLAGAEVADAFRLVFASLGFDEFQDINDFSIVAAIVEENVDALQFLVSLAIANISDGISDDCRTQRNLFLLMMLLPVRAGMDGVECAGELIRVFQIDDKDQKLLGRRLPVLSFAEFSKILLIAWDYMDDEVLADAVRFVGRQAKQIFSSELRIPVGWSSLSDFSSMCANANLIPRGRYVSASEFPLPVLLSQYSGQETHALVTTAGESGFGISVIKRTEIFSEITSECMAHGLIELADAVFATGFALNITLDGFLGDSRWFARYVEWRFRQPGSVDFMVVLEAILRIAKAKGVSQSVEWSLAYLTQKKIRAGKITARDEAEMHIKNVVGVAFERLIPRARNYLLDAEAKYQILQGACEEGIEDFGDLVSAYFKAFEAELKYRTESIKETDLWKRQPGASKRWEAGRLIRMVQDLNKLQVDDRRDLEVKLGGSINLSDANAWSLIRTLADERNVGAHDGSQISLDRLEEIRSHIYGRGESEGALAAFCRILKPRHVPGA